MNEQPLKQGDLDRLCGIYAVLNLLRHESKIGDTDQAFKKIIKYICLEGNLHQVVTAGLDCRDIEWIFKKLEISYTSVSEGEIGKYLGRKWVLVFLVEAGRKNVDRGFTHYSIITDILNISGGYTLFDSWGFDRLSALNILEPPCMYAQRKMLIKNAWVLP